MWQNAPPSNHERRNFFRWVTVALGGLIGLVPGLSGLAVLIDPLRKPGGKARELQRVTPLNALAVDVPKRFTLTGVIRDAWNEYSRELGALYLVRRQDKDGQPVVEAFQVICPHAGCSVVYHESAKTFQCPCHDSEFDLQGHILPRPDRPTPASRGLDKMPVSIEQGEVFVQYQKFQDGNGPKSIPVS